MDENGPTVPSRLIPAKTFDAACRLVLDYLTTAFPMGMWAVTRVSAGQQLMLAVDSPAYGVQPGDQFPFETSFCRPMAAGVAPQIAPDVVATPAYAAEAATAAANGVDVRAYVGTPIVRPDGRLFGTVCGFSPEAKPDSLRDIKPQLAVLSSLLSAVLQADTLATEAAREREQARHDADTDALTGLLNRRGWNRFLEHEESRFRRFGDPASVIVLDLDQLKLINDTAGHDAGDRHLVQTAAVLREVVRDADLLARLGGDEFGVIAVGINAEQAPALVDRIEFALEEAGIAGSVGHSAYSVVAGFPGAWSQADQAMYQRKQERRIARLSRVID